MLYMIVNPLYLVYLNKVFIIPEMHQKWFNTNNHLMLKICLYIIRMVTQYYILGGKSVMPKLNEIKSNNPF